MTRAKQRQLEGITNFHNRAEGTTSASVEVIAVTPSGVRHRIAPLTDRDGGTLVESGHPAVIVHTRRVLDAREAHARRLSPCRPAPKPGGGKMKAKPAREGCCPLCNGSGEEDDGMTRRRCRQCGGVGTWRSR